MLVEYFDNFHLLVDDIHARGCNIAEQALQRSALHVAAQRAAVVVTCRQHSPASLFSETMMPRKPRAGHRGC